MRWLKSGIIALFCICLVGFICHYEGWFEKKDTVGPVISGDSDLIEVSVNSGESELLAGVTAVDAVDGDVSSSLIISGMSLINSTDHSRTITYAAFDSSNNVSTWSRTVRYTDYTPPEFSLTRELTFYEGDRISILSYVRASDVIDGDISQNIKLVSGSDLYTTAGYYPVVVGVSNSCGDYSELELTLNVKTADKVAVSKTPEIMLSSYIVYLKKGEAFDPALYIKNVYSKVEGENIDGSMVSISSGIDTNTPGRYTVTYSVSNTLGYVGESNMMVIVSE